MPKWKLKRPSTGAALGFIAVVIAVAGNGGALAGTSHKITSADLARGAVNGRALAARAVTPRTIAPKAIHGEALGSVAMHTASVTVPGNSGGTWTTSNSVSSACVSRQRLLTGGVAITNPGDGRVAIIESQSTDNGTAWVGRITTNSTSTVSADVQVVCLK